MADAKRNDDDLGRTPIQDLPALVSAGRELARALIGIRVDESIGPDVQTTLLRSLTESHTDGDAAYALMTALLHACDWAAGLAITHADSIGTTPRFLFSETSIRFAVAEVDTT